MNNKKSNKKQTFLQFIEESALVNLDKYSNPGAVDIQNWRGDGSLPTTLGYSGLDDIIEKISGSKNTEPADKFSESPNMMDDFINSLLEDSENKSAIRPYSVVTNESHLVPDESDLLISEILNKSPENSSGLIRESHNKQTSRKTSSAKRSPLSILEDADEGNMLSKLINEMESMEDELSGNNDSYENQFPEDKQDHVDAMLARDEELEDEMSTPAEMFREMDETFGADEDGSELELEDSAEGEELGDLNEEDPTMEDPETLADADAESVMADDELDEVEDTLDDVEDEESEDEFVDEDEDDLSDLEEGFSLFEMDGGEDDLSDEDLAADDLDVEDDGDDDEVVELEDDEDDLDEEVMDDGDDEELVDDSEDVDDFESVDELD